MFSRKYPFTGYSWALLLYGHYKGYYVADRLKHLLDKEMEQQAAGAVRDGMMLREHFVIQRLLVCLQPRKLHLY